VEAMNNFPENRLKKFFTEDIERRYYIGFGIGLLLLIIAIIISIVVFPGQFLDIVSYPLIIYFILAQIVGGFAFITGYIPIAKWIIEQLTKSSKKKGYDEKKEKELVRKLAEIEKKEKRETKEIQKINEEVIFQEKYLEKKIEEGEYSRFKIWREKRKIEKKQEEIDKRMKELKEEVEKVCKECEEKLNGRRSKIEEKVLKKQEEMDPKRFKLILIIPLYVMTAIGIFIALWAIISSIIIWANNGITPTNFAFRVVDKIDWAFTNDIIKGISGGVSMLTVYIIPAVKKIKNPDIDFTPHNLAGRRRKISDWWKRKVSKDYRTLINRQFTDLQKYYFDIKQVLRQALLIPIGIAQFIVAPIGGLAIALGTKTGIERKEPNKMDNYILIIIAGAFIGILLFIYISGIAEAIKEIKIVVIIAKLLYGLSVAASFFIFSRMPISDHETL
jgi:hypothetical protein